MRFTISPPRDQPESSAIGIDVTLRAPLTWFSIGTQTVYFVRLDNERDIRQTAVLQSNYTKGGRVYLLNVPRGTTWLSRLSQPSALLRPPDYGRLCTKAELASAKKTCKNFYSYFSKELIELTRVNVGKAQFAFAGSYAIDNTPGLDNADPVQLHYAEVIAPGVRKIGPGEMIRETLQNVTVNAVESIATRKDVPLTVPGHFSLSRISS